MTLPNPLNRPTVPNSLHIPGDVTANAKGHPVQRIANELPDFVPDERDLGGHRFLPRALALHTVLDRCQHGQRLPDGGQVKAAYVPEDFPQIFSRRSLPARVLRQWAPFVRCQRPADRTLFERFLLKAPPVQRLAQQRRAGRVGCGPAGQEIGPLFPLRLLSFVVERCLFEP